MWFLNIFMNVFAQKQNRTRVSSPDLVQYVYQYVHDTLTFQLASFMYPEEGVWFLWNVKCTNCSQAPTLMCGMLWRLLRDEERLLRARDLERLMRSRTRRREMEWESRALKVAACIKFSQWEAVVGCFIWKQWSWSKWGSRLMGEPPVINNVSGWSGPGRGRHLKRKERSRPPGGV